jgi:hypothetical protein
MHRVYNSAFMNMLKEEENAKYRSVIKNTLEFNPEVLKRFVNFMSNPDEETAVYQFGREDKYFGICAMMVTLPGLPMFGHGQIEGFSEKYGMEYRYAKWDEQSDRNLVHRHEREIFPLMKRRHLFSDVKNFLLYDFFAPEGYVNENVFAYSNRAGGERTLVVYNNKYEQAKGWIRSSVAYSAKSGESEERILIQKTLGEGLGLTADESHFSIFRDHVNGLEYIRNSRELCEKGLYVELDAFKYQVFIDFREVYDNQWHQYRRLEAYLNGRGTPDIEETWKEILLQPLHHAFKELFNPALIHRVISARQALFRRVAPEARNNPPSTSPPPVAGQGEGGGTLRTFAKEIEQKSLNFLRRGKQESGGSGDETAIAKEIRNKLELALQLPTIANRLPWTVTKERKAVPEYLQANLKNTPLLWGALLGWSFTHALGKVTTTEDFAEQSRNFIDKWRLDKVIVNQLLDSGLDEGAAKRRVTLIKLLTRHQQWFKTGRLDQNQAYAVLDSLLKDDEVQEFIQTNRHDGILWFNKESFEELLFWLMLIAVVEIGSDPLRSPSKAVKAIEECYAVIQKFQEAEKKSDYQVEGLLAATNSIP